jgi:predicted transposase YdaD
MPKGPLHQPHDKLVKSTFSDSDNARAFLKNNIPRKLARRIDWNSLTLVSGSFIDPEFAATSSDLLFTAKIDGQPAFLYILFEHQNQEDPLIGMRLLTYIVRIWNDYLRNNPGATRLPPILPLVLAQDNKPWKSSIRFADLIDIPEGAGEMKKHIPDFEFQLVELFRMPYEKNPRHADGDSYAARAQSRKAPSPAGRHGLGRIVADPVAIGLLRDADALHPGPRP